jgi:predicted nucleotidyltransferase
MRPLRVEDYLDLKQELKSRIVRLVPEIVKSAYLYGSIATGDVSPRLSDPDVYVVLKTENSELPRHVFKRLFRGLW